MNKATRSLCLWLTCLTQSLAAAAADAGGRGTPAPLAATTLKTEHVINPLGVESPRPRLRWLLKSSERAQLQTAYQVQVASSRDYLNASRADKWDSGKV